MKSSAKILIFLLLLPFFGAIAYDIYANYFMEPKPKITLESLQALQPIDINPAEYQASDFGYLIVTYAKDYYDSAKQMVEPHVWTRWIDPILRLYSFAVALIPPVIFAVWLLIARVFDIWPFNDGLSSAPRYRGKGDQIYQAYEKRDMGKKVKYNRR